MAEEYYFDDAIGGTEGGYSGTAADYDSDFSSGSFMDRLNAGIDFYSGGMSVPAEYGEMSLPGNVGVKAFIEQADGADRIAAAKAEEGSQSIGKMLSDSFRKGYDSLKGEYEELDSQGKKFVWSAALGVFKSIMEGDSKDKYYSQASKASMMNARTNKDMLKLKQEQDARAASSASQAFSTVPGLIQQPFKPVSQTDITKRWS